MDDGLSSPPRKVVSHGGAHVVSRIILPASHVWLHEQLPCSHSAAACVAGVTAKPLE